MITWPKEKLRKIAEADDLHISPFGEDGVTYGTPTWIWSVAVDDALYVRSYNELKSRWYQAAVQQKAGRIIPAGMTKGSPSSLWTDRSTTGSMTSTGPSTMMARTSAQ
jgi:hypothetical protein